MGASRALLKEYLSVDEVKIRGRWLSDSAWRRYGKKGRAQKQLS